MGSSRVFNDPMVAHLLGSHHAILGFVHRVSRLARPSSATRPHRPLDATDLAVCLDHWRHRLLDAVQTLCNIVKPEYNPRGRGGRDALERSVAWIGRLRRIAGSAPNSASL